MNDEKAQARASGGCLCGSVRFAVRGPLQKTVVACHCRFCRRFTGGLWFGSCAHRDHVDIERGDTLTWYRSSLDEPTGLALAVHSWTAESADYRSFDPGVPRMPGPSGLGGAVTVSRQSGESS